LAKEEKKGAVKDLVEKLQRGEMTKEEVLGEMKRRGLHHHTGEPIPGTFTVSGIILWAILCFFPIICAVLGLDISIPSIILPIEVALGVFVFVIITTVPLFYSVHLRVRRSETGDENIRLTKGSAYGIIRHPAVLGGLIWLLALPIILAFELPLTVLSLLGGILSIIFLYLQTHHEEKINTKKWGDEYRQYMKEVPRFNIILGIWRLAKRRRNKT
jgi:protein-S-isoprenylcysteine O-methyltransferase Ste14